MKNRYIWPESALEALIDHPEQEVREWAVFRMFSLYPASARRRLPLLLQDHRAIVAVSALRGLDFVARHLDDQERTEIIPVLKALFLEGEPALSSRAIYILGEWKVTEAVHWIEERIVQGTPLSSGQIASMISALGSIPDESAYSLLKQTEQGVEEKDFPHWELFHEALLSHKKQEDIDTMVRIFADQEEPEDRRRKALGLLAALIDPVLNPSDLFFGNHSGARDHLKERMDYLSEEASLLPDSPDLGAKVRALRDFVEEFQPEDLPGAIVPLEVLGRIIDSFEPHQRHVFQAACNQVRESPSADGVQAPLAWLALSALTEGLIDRAVPGAPEAATWQDKLSDLLKDRYPKSHDEAYEDHILREAPPAELLSLLKASLQPAHPGWGMVRALDILGRMQPAEADPEVAGLILEMVNSVQDPTFSRAAEEALLHMGPAVLPALVPFLDHSNPHAKSSAVRILAERPTPEVVEAFLGHLPKLYAHDSQSTLDALTKLAAKEFLPLLEEEYYPGEWSVGKTYIHIARVNHLDPPRFRKILQDVQRSKAFREQQERLLRGDYSQWPTTLLLELACNACGKLFHYEVKEVHLLPTRAQDNEQYKSLKEAPAGDFLYQHGIVIGDDLHCKNCQALNQMKPTPNTLSMITAESFRLLGYHRLGLSVPQYYPLKQVQLGEKDGKPLGILDVEQSHLDAAHLNPSKPQVHLALGKFYEYVKVYPKARQYYLKALDLDSKALEGMAGLARVYRAEGKLKEACDWLDHSYLALDEGHFYLTEDTASFKKAVREKRREFTRELGMKMEDQPVKVRFQIEESDHPKNRPCPCGSGKKYKLCCMKKTQAED